MKIKSDVLCQNFFTVTMLLCFSFYDNLGNGENQIEKLTKKCVKKLNLETRTFGILLSDGDLETENIYSESRKSYLYDVTSTFVLLNLMATLYKKKML